MAIKLPDTLRTANDTYAIAVSEEIKGGIVMNWMVFASVLLIAALALNVLALAVYGFLWFNFIVCIADAILLIANFVFFFFRKK